MARIMLAFFAGLEYQKTKIPVFYDSTIKLLSERGHEVQYIAHRFWGDMFDWSAEIPADLKEQIQSYDPDLFIIWNNSFFDIRKLVKCPIVIFDADSIEHYANKQFIRETPERYLFWCAKETRELLISHYRVRAEQICDAIPFSGIEPEEKEIEDNIVFIASKFSVLNGELNNNLVKFMATNPTDEERAEFKGCLNYIKHNPYQSIDEMRENGVIKSLKVMQYLVGYDWQKILNDEKRMNVLSAVADMGLRIYGTVFWATEYYYRSELSLAYSSKSVMSLKENADAYNSAKIGISASVLKAVNGFPWRIMDIMQSNACLVSDYHRDFDSLFSKDLFPVYHDQYEAREICKNLLQDEEKRLRIVENCQIFAKENYSFDRVAEAMTKLTGVRI